jgi:diaminopimelate epimerase
MDRTLPPPARAADTRARAARPDPARPDTATTRTLRRMEFTKAHGTANDFVVLADLDDRLELSDALVRALADRRRGVGADGVIRIGAGGSDAHAFMDYRNADGSIVEMCGNGVRVVAKHIVDHGLVAPDPDGTVRVGTRAGVKPVRITGRHPDGSVATVAVDMGPPEFDPAKVPFTTDDPEAERHPIGLGDDLVQLSVVSMGNPHGVLLVDDLDAAPVTTLGPRLERDGRFPQGANIGFAHRLDDDAIALRVWERGVGETAACGTGACAATVALQRLGLVREEVAVHLPGGTLTVHHAPGGTVTMTGPAVEVAHGVLDTAWVAAARRGEME